MNFRPQTGETDSFAIIDHALEQGINFIDTANAYGVFTANGDTSHLHLGLTAEIPGRWLAQNGRRDLIVLATRVFVKMGEGVNQSGLSAYHIGKACKDSLRRLRTDHIYLYQMHHTERSTRSGPV